MDMISYVMGQKSVGGGGALVVHMDAETGALDKTAGEIREALKTGVVNIVVEIEYDDSVQVMAICLVGTMSNGSHAGEIHVTAFVYDNMELLEFYAATADDYPVLDDNVA